MVDAVGVDELTREHGEWGRKRAQDRILGSPRGQGWEAVEERKPGGEGRVSELGAEGLAVWRTEDRLARTTERLCRVLREGIASFSNTDVSWSPWGGSFDGGGKEGTVHFEEEVGSTRGGGEHPRRWEHRRRWEHETVGADNCPRVVLGAGRLRDGEEGPGTGPPKWMGDALQSRSGRMADACRGQRSPGASPQERRALSLERP